MPPTYATTTSAKTKSMILRNRFEGMAFPGTPPKPIDSFISFSRISLLTPPEDVGGFDDEGSSSS